jgi:hypothetical protein
VPPSPSTEDPLDKLDQLVDAAPEPENAVLTDNAPVVRWTGPLFALLAVILPLAGLCLWLSYHTHQIAERRILLLHRRPRRGRRR